MNNTLSKDQEEQPELPAAASDSAVARPVASTIALSLIFHGEAVRFNRGQGVLSGYDFKFMRGPRDEILPYVSSQCFKKHWRDAIGGPFSPIFRATTTAGKAKNQAYTSGKPYQFEDDDLFGYMIAGASAEKAEEEAEASGEEGNEEDKQRQQEEAKSRMSFAVDQLKKKKEWPKRLTTATDSLTEHLKTVLKTSASEEVDGLTDNHNLTPELAKAIVQALNETLEDESFYKKENFPKISATKLADLTKGAEMQVREKRFANLQAQVKPQLEDEKKQDTTRRTAPIRMHALLAFSGIKKASDFQVMARDVESTGLNSVLNPNRVGIYSGWLKTRILIECFRVGKFYIGKNMDLLAEDLPTTYEQLPEINPYSKSGEMVSYIQLPASERRERIKKALCALGEIGNTGGPASGALHDGSLKPRAFVGAFMKCADSPFDVVWVGSDDAPRLDLRRLGAVIADWKDLFESKTIYIGLSPDLVPGDDEQTIDESLKEFQERVTRFVNDKAFTVEIGLTRAMLKQMAEAVTIEDISGDS